MPLSVVDRTAILNFGAAIVPVIAATITESVLYGGYLSLMSVAMRIFWRKRPLSRPQIVMFSAMFLMFSASTTLLGLDILNIVKPIKNILNGDEDALLVQYWEHMDVQNVWFTQTILYTVEFILGDAVVVWRACSLFQMRRSILAAPTFMLIASLGLTLYFVACSVDIHFHLNKAFVARPATCTSVQTAAFFTSVATNCLATSMVAYKAWRHRKSWNEVYPYKGSNSRRSRVDRILLLLVESGFIYMLFYLAKGFTYFTSTPALADNRSLQAAASILNSMGNQVVGLYPTLLIVLVAIQDEVTLGHIDIGAQQRAQGVSGMLFSTMSVNSVSVAGHLGRSIQTTYSSSGVSESDLTKGTPGHGAII